MEDESNAILNMDLPEHLKNIDEELSFFSIYDGHRFYFFNSVDHMHLNIYQKTYSILF
jgi:hypothetical protein